MERHLNIGDAFLFPLILPIPYSASDLPLTAQILGLNLNLNSKAFLSQNSFLQNLNNLCKTIPPYGLL